MKSTRIIFWTCTILIVLFEGLLPALTFNTEIARQGVSHLGYPDYFRVWFTFFKVIGAIILILPPLPRRMKDWAYAGFTFDFLFAAISHGAVDGVSDGQTWFPLAVLAILMASYVTYNKLYDTRRRSLEPRHPAHIVPQP